MLRQSMTQTKHEADRTFTHKHACIYTRTNEDSDQTDIAGEPDHGPADVLRHSASNTAVRTE